VSGFVEQSLMWETAMKCRDCPEFVKGVLKGEALKHARENPGHRVVFHESTIYEAEFSD